MWFVNVYDVNGQMLEDVECKNRNEALKTKERLRAKYGDEAVIEVTYEDDEDY